MDQAAIEDMVRKSRSNLAMTLVCLPKEARQDMQLFYAFCRIVDDIADEPGRSVEQRHTELQRWRDVVEGGTETLIPIESAVQRMMAQRNIPAEEMLGIIAGVSQDIQPRRYATWEELKHYCHGVASCVGLVSVRIFGCTMAESREYAVALGYALQLTNILRDIGEDLSENGRIYLPQEDLDAFGVTDADLRAGSMTESFVALMRMQTNRARDYYSRALTHLTPADKPRLRAAETMRRVYSRVLEMMEKDRFHVFEKRYRVSTLGKLYFLARAVIGGWLGR
ncbi:MAG: squalene/phytoene synthase family protein [Verrucomicrobiaceae bacterium]